MVRILQSEFETKRGGKGKLAIFIYSGTDNPVPHLNHAIREYVKTKAYHELVESSLDNPWMKVILSDINEINQEDFDPKKHSL